MRLGPLQPNTQYLGWSATQTRFELPLHNQFEHEVSIQVRGEDSLGRCHFHFSIPARDERTDHEVTGFSLATDESVTLVIDVWPPSAPLFGLMSQNYHLNLVINNLTDGGAPKTLLLRLARRPILGWPAIGLLIALVLIVAVSFFRAGSTVDNNSAANTNQAAVNRPVTNQAINRGVETNRIQGQVSASEAALDLTGLTYETMFRQVATEYDLDWRMLATMAYHESYLDPGAVGGLQEMGLMQILPSTWDEWAAPDLDPFNPYDNLQVSATYQVYLRNYLSQHGADDDKWVLAAYNWGPDNVRYTIESGAGWQGVPSKVRQYALKIMQVENHPVWQDDRLYEPVKNETP